MTWIDGFVIPVKREHEAVYRTMAKAAAPIFLEHGALQVIESWGADVPHGEVTDFFRAVAAEPDENVVFSLIVWPSREAQASGNRAAMDDPRMADAIDMSVFAGKRMIFGGFEQILDTRSPDTGE